MSSKENAYRRISGLGRLVAECQAQALHYGNCVSRRDNVEKNACEKEFQALKACIKKAARKTKS